MLEVYSYATKIKNKKVGSTQSGTFICHRYKFLKNSIIVLLTIRMEF